jgi:hypothetical protein
MYSRILRNMREPPSKPVIFQFVSFRKKNWRDSPKLRILRNLSLAIPTIASLVILVQQTQILERQTKIQLRQTDPYLFATAGVGDSKILWTVENVSGIVRNLNIELVSCAITSFAFPEKNSYKIKDCSDEPIFETKGQGILINYNSQIQKLWQFYKILDREDIRKTNFISQIKASYINAESKLIQTCGYFSIGLSEEISKKRFIAQHSCSEKINDTNSFNYVDQITIQNLNYEEFKSKLF